MTPKTGSGSYLDMFLMFSKINNLLLDLYTKSKHLILLKIKDKHYFDETTLLYNEKIRITWVFFVDKGSGCGIFPDPDPGDPKRPNPTGSGSATLLKSVQHCANFVAEFSIRKCLRTNS